MMRKNYSSYFLAILLATMTFFSYGQVNDSTKQSSDRKKVNTFIIAGGVTYGVSLIVLNELWYKDYPRTKFHFFNDNAEWYKLDKVGHTLSAYHISEISYGAFTNGGYNKKQALLAAGLTSFLLMTPIEWLDGYSTAYGASIGDMVANTMGFAVFFTQTLAFNKQLINIKYGFWPSSFAKFRPNVLGKSIPEQMLKDYNGQTFWLSLDLHEMISNRIPKWLNLGIGYGADGMVHAREPTNLSNGYVSFRQWYISIDPDFSHVQKKNKLVTLGLGLLRMVRIPAPSIELSQKTLKWHWLSF